MAGLILLPLAAGAQPESEEPFASFHLTPELIAKASPFFTVDGRARPLMAEAPDRLEDLQILRLWPRTAPLQQGDDPAIDIPTMTVFVPPSGKATGSAMIVYPGGGYSHLAPKEVLPTVQWLASNGITAFLVKYRLGPKYHEPAQLDDGLRAVRYVRSHAQGWELDPKRVGVLGFSAGGHMVSTISTRFDTGDPQSADPVDRASSRPDLQIDLYGVMNLDDDAIVHKPSRTMLFGDNPPRDLLERFSNEKHVNADAPPAMVVHSTGDTTVPIENSDRYVAALTAHNVPVIYIRGAFGRHGFGLTDDWSGEALAWLKKRGF